jgi:DNA (cytosine-5)-methyltransferase 1
MRVLDLFCGGGGAARGYVKAGATVDGVDIKSHWKSYPGDFYIADALKFAVMFGRNYDFIHASPPCQGYSSHTTSHSSKYVSYSKGKDEPKLISKIREVLEDTNKPFVIENVMGARNNMEDPFVLCGTMFGLPISRHRLFETNFFIPIPSHGKCSGVAKRYAVENNIDYRDMSVTGKGRNKGTKERWCSFMGIKDTAMTQAEIAEAVPPAYTEYIFRTWREFYG